VRDGNGRMQVRRGGRKSRKEGTKNGRNEERKEQRHEGTVHLYLFPPRIIGECASRIHYTIPTKVEELLCCLPSSFYLLELLGMK
jgi:hypothetical protein